MTDETKIVARCVQCSGEFTEKDIEGAKCCPKCGTRSIPMSPDNDITLNINWHELRILTIWAEQWARRSDKNAEENPEQNPNHENMMMTVMTIAQRLQAQYPDKTPLTLFSEIRELRKNYDVVSDLDDDSQLGLS